MRNDDDGEGISWVSRIAWNKYNPPWLLDKVDEDLKTEPDDPMFSKIFDIGDMRQAFRDGFVAGTAYFITKEIPSEGGK